MKRKISVFGLGYVGSVTAACLAHKGHDVVGVDINSAKIQSLEAGHSPIVEPGLEELVADGRNGCHLRATADAVPAVLGSEVSLICVGTPSERNGKPNLSHVEQVCRQIGEAIKRKQDFHWVVLRSTVLPGTTESMVIPVLERTSGKRVGIDFGVCFNPEFIREGTAVLDFFNPCFTVLGTANLTCLQTVRDLYDELPCPMFETTVAAAEMVKYACNAFHALKVSFANEIGTLCKSLGVETHAVTQIFTSDNRLNISAAYLSPGYAFGGSCLPKDLRALTSRARELDLQLPLLEGILPSNTLHIRRAADAVLNTNARKVGVLGLSFKSGTDDLRESPLVQLIKLLIGEGLEIRIWDREVSLGRLVGSNRQYIEEVIPHIGSLLRSTLEEVIGNSEAVIIGTRAADPKTLREHLRPDQAVIDLVNLNPSDRSKTTARYDGICW